MKTMLDLTQNRYSSQWRADNAKEEWYVSPREIYNPLEIWQMGPYDTEAEAKEMLQWMKNHLQKKLKDHEKFLKDAKDSDDKKYYTETVKKYKDALSSLKITDY
jgi:hypothetical protein